MSNDNLEIEYKLHLHEANSLSIFQVPGLAIKQGYFDLGIIEFKLIQKERNKLVITHPRKVVEIPVSDVDFKALKKVFVEHNEKGIYILPSERKPGARVRKSTTVDGESFYEVTIKAKPESKISGVKARVEVDVKIEKFQSELLFDISRESIVEKTRFIFPSETAGVNWEVDVFHGLNEGLVIAEAEVPNEDTPMPKPHASWKYTNITENGKLTNKSLAFVPIVYLGGFKPCRFLI